MADPNSIMNMLTTGSGPLTGPLLAIRMWKDPFFRSKLMGQTGAETFEHPSGVYQVPAFQPAYRLEGTQGDPNPGSELTTYPVADDPGGANDDQGKPFPCPLSACGTQCDSTPCLICIPDPPLPDIPTTVYGVTLCGSPCPPPPEGDGDGWDDFGSS